MSDPGKHQCLVCQGWHTDAGDTRTEDSAELLVRVIHAREDMARYRRWLVVWTAAFGVLGAALTVAIVAGQLGLVWLFSVLMAADAVGFVAWFAMHTDHPSTRTELRRVERDYRCAVAAEVIGNDKGDA